MWRKICHVEKFQIFIHDRCGDIWNLSTSVMWRYFRFPHITNVKKSEMWRIQKLLHMWRNFKFLHNTDVICDLCYFVANLFCRNLRAFVWRKIYPKIIYVEKKWQISGMLSHSTFDPRDLWPLKHLTREMRTSQRSQEFHSGTGFLQNPGIPGFFGTGLASYS